jgi:hypothetical protein
MRVTIFEPRFYSDFLTSTEWYPKEFIISLGAYLWHEKHDTPGHNVEFVFEPYTKATAKRIILPQIKHLAHVAINPNEDHYSVLHFDLEKRVIVVYDGLEMTLETWIDEAEMVLRIYSQVPELIGGRKKWKKTRRSCGWHLVRSVDHVKQRDGYSCGPLACQVLMILLGGGGEVRVPIVEMDLLRRAVAARATELIQKYSVETYSEKSKNWMVKHGLLKAGESKI